MKKSVIIGIELTLFCMIVGTLVSYAAGSNPPSNGVRYGSTTVQSALDDLYNKISSGSTSCLPTRSPDTSTIAVGGSRTYSSGTYANSWTVSCANKTCPTCPSDVYKKYTLPRTEVKLDTTKTISECQQTFTSGTWKVFTKKKDCQAYFTVPLSFTPSEVVAIDIEMRGNYVSSSSNTWDANFKSPNGNISEALYFRNGASGRYSTTDSTKDWSDGWLEGSISGNQLILKFQTATGGTGSTNYSYQTRADKFYVEGTIIYK